MSGPRAGRGKRVGTQTTVVSIDLFKTTMSMMLCPSWRSGGCQLTGLFLAGLHVHVVILPLAHLREASSSSSFCN